MTFVADWSVPLDHSIMRLLEAVRAATKRSGTSSPVARIRAGNMPLTPSGSTNWIWLSCCGVNPDAFEPKMTWCWPPPVGEPFEFATKKFTWLDQATKLLLAKRTMQLLPGGSEKVAFVPAGAPCRNGPDCWPVVFSSHIASPRMANPERSTG